MRMARHSIWARAKIGMGWSDPTFGGFQPPKDFVGSLQPNVWKKSPPTACFACAKRREGSNRMALYFKLPFPAENVFLQVMALRAPLVHEGLFYSYNLFLFTTPYIAFSIVLSGLYVFGLTLHKKIRAGKLPLYPDPRKREELFVVVGEVHNKRKQGPSETPHWLTIPERGLFTGTAIVGAIGTGKTSCCMYPFAEQILAYRASDKEKRIGGLFLEVKGDFCHKVRDILKRHERAEDYVEIGLGSEYRYNPLNNDLDAYALAYNIASLLNNLFGRGKEPFWQQAYTNLVKFIILLHKVAYGYVIDALGLKTDGRLRILDK